jgi:ferredoxin
MGIAMCRSIAPAAFSLGDNGQALFVPGSGVSPEDLLEAAENCPVEAITVEQTD